MDIQQAHTLLVAETGARMASLAEPVSIARKAEALRDVSRLFQALAICKLLAFADVPKFLEHLIRSGQSRRYYLQKSRESGHDNDRFLGLSRVQAIMDVLVAGDMRLARDIVDLSIDRWHDGWEYEDDYCYYAFIHGLVADRDFIDRTEAAALLTRFQRALAGQSSVRLRLCKALGARDGVDFRAAFARLIAEYAVMTDVRRSKFTEYTSDAPSWPGCFVSIEALAWLVIGGMYGISLPDQYRFCPLEARGPVTTPQVADLFESLDQALAAP
jgi:hypothetical protein